MEWWLLAPTLLLAGCCGWLACHATHDRPAATIAPPARSDAHARLSSSLRSWLTDERVVRVILDQHVTSPLRVDRGFVSVVLRDLETSSESALWNVARMLLANRAIRMVVELHRPGSYDLLGAYMSIDDERRTA